MKPKFDGYAAQYDAWFMENDNLFQSELRLFQRALGNISGQRVLSVGCGSGLFESMIDHSGIEGIEPSRDMGAIAQKRGVNVITFGAIEDTKVSCCCEPFVLCVNVTRRLHLLYQSRPVSPPAGPKSNAVSYG